MNDEEEEEVGTYKAPTVIKLGIDDDGYITFMDRDVIWYMHDAGWEAFDNGYGDEPVYSTSVHTFPTDRDLRWAQQIEGVSHV